MVPGHFYVKSKPPCFWALIYLVKGIIGTSHYGIGQCLVDRTNAEQTTKILFMLSHIFFVCLFFPEILISSIHNQYPVNEMISVDDTGCHKDKDTLFGSCRTENAE